MSNTARFRWTSGNLVFKNKRKNLVEEVTKQKRFEAYQPTDSADPGVMIALKLPADVAEQLAVPNGNSAEELHCTLVYLGKLSTLDNRWNGIATLVDSMASAVKTLSGSINGIGRLAASESSDGKEVVYATLDVPGLAKFRTELVEALEDAGFKLPNDHDFIPHITLSYVEPGELLDVPLPDVPVSFDRVYLWAGDRREEFPLTRHYHLPGQHDQCDHSTTGGCVADDNSLRADLFKSEREIVKGRLETGVVFTQDGKKVFSKIGNESSIEWTKSELRKMKDGVFTHNHPTADTSGNRAVSFSMSDVRVGIIADVAEMRVVSDDPNLGTFLFIMNRPASGWPNINRASARLNTLDGKVYRFVESQRPRLKHENWLLVGEHLRNALFAKEFGIKYKLIRKRKK